MNRTQLSHPQLLILTDRRVLSHQNHGPIVLRPYGICHQHPTLVVDFHALKEISAKTDLFHSVGNYDLKQVFKKQLVALQ